MLEENKRLPKVPKKRWSKTKTYFCASILVLILCFSISQNGISVIGSIYRNIRIEKTWKSWKKQAAKEPLNKITQGVHFKNSNPLSFNDYLKPVLYKQNFVKYHKIKKFWNDDSNEDPWHYTPTDLSGYANDYVFSYLTGLIYELSNSADIENDHIIKYDVNHWNYDSFYDDNFNEFKFAKFANRAIAQNLLGIIKVVKKDWITAGITASDLSIVTNYQSTLDYKNPIKNSGKLNITIGCTKLKQQASCQISCPIKTDQGNSTTYDVNYWKLL